MTGSHIPLKTRELDHGGVEYQVTMVQVKKRFVLHTRNYLQQEDARTSLVGFDLIFVFESYLHFLPYDLKRRTAYHLRLTQSVTSFHDQTLSL